MIWPSVTFISFEPIRQLAHDELSSTTAVKQRKRFQAAQTKIIKRKISQFSRWLTERILPLKLNIRQICRWHMPGWCYWML